MNWQSTWLSNGVKRMTPDTYLNYVIDILDHGDIHELKDTEGLGSVVLKETCDDGTMFTRVSAVRGVSTRMYCLKTELHDEDLIIPLNYLNIECTEDSPYFKRISESCKRFIPELVLPGLVL